MKDTFSISNGAGCIKTMPEFLAALKGAGTEITLGSVTVEPRQGNLGEVYYHDDVGNWSVNALGLPNYGMVYYLGLLPGMIHRAQEVGKRVWVSIAGFTPEEYAKLAEYFLHKGAHGIEVNLACRNVWDGGKNKSVASHDPGLCRRISEHLSKKVSKGAHLRYKFAPDTNYGALNEIVERSNQYDFVRGYVATNALGGQTKLKQNGMFALNFRDREDGELLREGSVGGSLVHKHAVALVKLINPLMSSDQTLVGCGGVTDGATAKAMLDAGANQLQTTSAWLKFGPKIVSDIFAEMVDLERL
jgi:dihydroorotate dehydrogenase (fumarate)